MNPGDLRHRIEILTNQKAKMNWKKQFMNFFQLKNMGCNHSANRISTKTSGGYHPNECHT